MPSMAMFLLAGQSNMAGRGRMEAVAPIHDPEIWMFREGAWKPAVEPLHTDKPAIAGIGLAMSFAAVLRRELARPIGLLPCAFGGTPLSRWLPDGDLYAQAVATARQAAATRTGVLSAILWHQGENDSTRKEDAESYGRRLQSMIEAFRRDFGRPDLPFVAGELGPFLKEPCLFADVINRQLHETAARVAHMACVSAAALTDNGDALHFNASSLRLFGERYARAYIGLATAQPTVSAAAQSLA